MLQQRDISFNESAALAKEPEEPAVPRHADRHRAAADAPAGGL
jgi:hypothetical protein